MKRVIVIIWLLLSSLNLYVTKEEIELQKSRAIKWYENNEHLQGLKNRSLDWYDKKITKGKFYFVHTNIELEFTKNKALKWYEKVNK